MNPDPTAAKRTPEDDALKALDWAVDQGHADTLIGSIRARGRRRRLRAASVLAGGAMLALTAFFLWPSPVPLAPSPAIPSNAIVVQPRTQTLTDGTIVELKADASIAVEFTDDFRRVLLPSGEAHFQVAKNPARPFIVVAGGVEVRAVGTAFAVQLNPDRVSVLVTEGTVAIEKPDEFRHVSSEVRPDSGVPANASRHVATVNAGNRIDIPVSAAADMPHAPSALPPAEAAAALAWRVPNLEFTGTRLDQAIPMFNTYAKTKLTLDPSLGALQLSGGVRADDTESLLLLLKNEFGIEARPGENGETKLGR